MQRTCFVAVDLGASSGRVALGEWHGYKQDVPQARNHFGPAALNIREVVRRTVPLVRHEPHA